MVKNLQKFCASFQIVVGVDAFTCLLCGFIVFSTMGNLALEQGKTVEDIVTDGPGNNFKIYLKPVAILKICFTLICTKAK